MSKPEVHQIAAFLNDVRNNRDSYQAEARCPPTHFTNGS